MRFDKKLSQITERKKSLLCVGIDPDARLIGNTLGNQPANNKEIEDFCIELIDATIASAAAYKINSAYFEALGSKGFEIMFRVCEHIGKDALLIADAKRGDIAHTNAKYKTAFFDELKADAITLNPLLGFETFEPFLHDESKCIYSLALTSNPGSADFLLRPFGNRATLSQYIAEALKERQASSETILGMVIGATHQDVVKPIINGHPEAPLLMPGVGTQGGKISDLAGLINQHSGIPLITISRSIAYPKGVRQNDWQQKAADTAESYRTTIEIIRKKNVTA